MRSILVAVTMAAGLAVSVGPTSGPFAVALAQDDAAEAPVKQIALDDAAIANLIAAKPDVDAAIASLPEGTEEPDAKAKAKLDAAAKKHGFATFGDYEAVESNVGLVMAGFDPSTKAYIGPEAVIKKQMTAIEADKKLSAKDKKEALDDLKAALTSTPKLEHQENIAVVQKHYDQLAAAMPQD